jgi:hypothetical protein
MSGLNKDRIIFDPTDPTVSEDIGAYIRASDGTLITHTNVGGKDGLDVNIINPITVNSASDRAEDSAHTSGDVGSYILAVRQDTLTSSTSADGDYASFKVDSVGSLYTRDTGVKASLDSVIKTDNGAFTDGASMGLAMFGVDAANTYQPFKLNAAGELLVAADVSVTTGSDKVEDSAHANADVGTYILSVREDTLTSSTSASGDYQSIKTDALGRMYTNDAHQSMLVTPKSVTTTASALVASSLANRKQILVQNISSKNVYLGTSAAVTDVNGFKLGAGMSIELDLAAAVALFAISVGAAADVRIIELA